jgi:hypothetical protein
MRIAGLVSVSLLCLAATAFSAGAVTPPERGAAVSDGNIVRVAEGCGRGYHWVPRGYNRGRWRAGHCAPN